MSRTDFEIEQVTLRRVKIAMHEPFRIANGSVSEKESIVIEVRSEGCIGFGEASPMPGGFYSADTPDSVWRALKNDLVPDLLKATVQSGVDYAEQLEGYDREPFARAGIEGAVWDLIAQKFHTSINKLLAPKPVPIPSGLAVGLYDTVDELLDQIAKYLAQGYQRVKIKIQPGWDAEPLTAIRKKFGDIPLMVDANASYELERDRTALLALGRFDLIMIEQPLGQDQLDDLARLSKLITTPICVDESADSLESLEEVIVKKAASIVNIKVQRVGGLWNARRMHDRALRAGLDCWLGTMPELGIASAQALEIASLSGFVYPTDIEASDRWFVDDIISPKITLASDGTIDYPKGGYAVDLEKLSRYTVQEETFTR